MHTVFAPLAELINRLNQRSPLTKSEADVLSRQTTAAAVGRMLCLGETFGEASDDLAILSQFEDAFRAELRSTDNDLDRQIEIVNGTLDGWFTRGMTPGPYYAWRVAVILAKEKRMGEERDFLAAWCRHFGELIGVKYEALADRARKRGLTF